MEAGTLPEHGGVFPSCSPVVSPHGDNGEFGQGDVLMESNGYLLGAPDSQTILTIVVPDGVKCLNLVHWPAQVCFCMGMTFKASSLRHIPRKMSVMSDSLMGKKREISSRDFIYLYVLDQVAQLSLASLSSRIQAGPLLCPTPRPQEHLHYLRHLVYSEKRTALYFN